MTLLLDLALLEEERREWKGLVVILGPRGVYSGLKPTPSCSSHQIGGIGLYSSAAWRCVQQPAHCKRASRILGL